MWGGPGGLDAWVSCVGGVSGARTPGSLVCGGKLGSPGTRVPCVWVIYGDQGASVGFVVILWGSDAWVSCVCGIYGAQMPGFLVHGGDLWG